MKIVILDAHTENPGDLSWAGFEALGEVTVYDRTPKFDDAEIVRRIGDADIVVTNKTPVRALALDACPTIKYVGLLSTGTDVCDCAHAAALGIPVSNIPAYSTMAVAQHTIALLLEICSKVGVHSAAVHAGDWQRSEDFCFWEAPLIELAGLTFGAVGFGQIGKAAGRIARALGMRVLAAGSRPTDEGRAIGEYVDLETLLRESDVVSLHCPLKDETRRLISADTIGKMKTGAILLNTGRGGLVDEEALAAALKSGKLYAAGVDVVSVEPILPENPLLACPNCFITPHIAWTPRTCRERVMDIAVANAKAFLSGRPENVVNGVTSRK